MYLSILKWNLYSKIKKTFLNLSIFNVFPQKIMLLTFIFFKLIEMYFVALITNIILKGDNLNTGISYIDIALKKIQENKIILLIIFLIYILIYMIKSSIKAVNTEQESHYKEWLIITAHISSKKLTMLLVMDYLIFNSIEILTLQLPIIYTIMIYNQNQVMLSILTCIIYFFNIELIMGILSYIYYKYLCIIKKLKSSSIVIFQSIYMRIVFLYIFYNIGLCFSKWFNKFPLVSNEVSILDFEKWISSVSNCVEIILLSIKNMNIINNIIFNVILLIIMFILFYFIHRFSINCMQNVRFGKKGYLKYIFKSINKSEYTFRHLNVLCGSISYWCLIGFYLGILKYIELGSKVFYFIIVSYMFYPIYILVNYLFDKYQGNCCIDGEGQKIYYWVPNNIYKLFKGKRLYFSFNLSLIIIISNLLMFLINNCSSILILYMTICQISFMCTVYSLFSLSSIVFPHFERSNIEELDRYLDRRQFKETIDFFILVIGISVLVIPTALYLTDYIVTIQKFILIQFTGVTLLLILINCFLSLYIKSKVNNQDFFNLIFER